MYRSNERNCSANSIQRDFSHHNIIEVPDTPRMASGDNGSSTRLVLRQGNDNPGIVVVSPESIPRQLSNSRELHLPPIRPQKLDMGLSDRSPVDQTLDDGQGVAAHLSRRLSATEFEVGTYRIDHQVSLRKETEDYSKTRENKSILRTKDRLSFCDNTERVVEIDDEVKQRTELYKRGGRRYSLPVGRSSQPARMQTTSSRVAEHQQEGCSGERDASKALLGNSETSPRRVDFYKRLGRRYSLPPQGLASRRQTDAQQRLTEGTASDSSRPGLLDSSTDTDDYFSCTGSMRSNLTPLDEDLDETDLQIERYIHQGRRCSLPPANHLNSRFKSSNGTNHLHDQAEVLRRAPTPIAADCQNLNGLYLKQSGFHTMKAYKSAESLGNVEPFPPSLWRDVPDLNANLSGRRPRGYRAKRDTPTGVTWETKPTHKTFSFTYNDANNVSEMLTPPVTGGIVLKSLQADRPSEPQSPEPESTTDPVDNKDTEHIQWYSPQNRKFISPTVQVLKDSWRRENNEEKTIRILRWIANEQSQRLGEDGY